MTRVESEHLMDFNIKVFKTRGLAVCLVAFVSYSTQPAAGVLQKMITSVNTVL